MRDARSARAEFDYKDFFENGGLALHVVDGDGTIIHANQAEFDLLGYEADDYIGRNIGEFYPDADVVDDILARLRRGEKIDKYPARLCTSDGSIKHVEITSTAHFEGGQLVATRCFTVEVTDLQRARAELVSQDNQFHQILDKLPVAVYTTDEEGILTYFNPAAAELPAGRQKSAKTSGVLLSACSILTARNCRTIQCPMAIALRENRPVRNQEALAQRPDGTLFPFQPFPTPIRNENGELIGAVNMLVDLSERAAAEEARQHLSAIIESSYDAVVSKNLNGIITSWNGGAERLFGYTADEAIGNPVNMLIPEDHQDEEPHILDRIRKGERVDSYETVRQRKEAWFRSR